MEHRSIYCVACGKDVEARLTDGAEIYPDIDRLAHLAFWKCDTCGNYAGTLRLGKRRNEPLGCIATPELMAARKRIHKILNPIWEDSDVPRVEVYRRVSVKLGIEAFHAAELRSLEAAREAYRAVQAVAIEVAKKGKSR